MAESGRDTVARRRVPRAKILVPELPPQMVSRPRLLAALDRAREGAVTLVCAPAGSGKTLLLAEWVRRTGADNAAWVSLESDDNDDRRFWSGVLGALTACAAVPEGNPLRTLAVPAQPSSEPGFLAELVDALDMLPVAVPMVLDDLHELTATAPLRGLATLIRHQPAGLRLLLATRLDPPLPIARLRLTGQLGELRADDLRFSSIEAQHLLAAADIQLGKDELRQLVERTEGWAAGLRLATVALRTTRNPGRYLANFAENDRSVGDYLITEVLSGLTEEMREFLRSISVCDELSASLATALSGRADAGEMLDSLERQTALLVRVGAGRQWFHVHALLRAQLFADLHRRTPDRAARLHGKAADWFEARQLPAQALAHATQAQDNERTAALVRKHAVTLLLTGVHDVLTAALDALGERAKADDPLLPVLAAHLHLEAGEAKLADFEFARVTAPQSGTDPELDLLLRLGRSRLAQAMGDVTDVVRAAEDLDRWAQDESPLAGLTRLHQATAYLAAGKHGDARDLATAALECAQEGGYPYLEAQCRIVLGGLAAIEGDVRELNSLMRRADSAVTEHGWHHTVVGATVSAQLAYSALLNASADECLDRAVRAAQVVDSGTPSAHLALTAFVGTLRGAALFDLGERVTGLQHLRQARQAVAGARLTPEQVALAAVLEHRAATLLGRADVAKDVQRWARETIPTAGECRLIRARSLIALGRYAAARKVAVPLLDGTAESILPWSAVEAWLVETEIAVHLGDNLRARRALAKALTLGERMDTVHPLVFAAPVVADLLIRQRGRLGGSERFAGRVLTARSSLRTQPIPAPLTERERAVLRLLPTVRSFEEIAQDLTLSRNTVKTHVRAIYQKLDVRTRREAVLAAMDRGLLDGSSRGTYDPSHDDSAGYR